MPLTATIMAPDIDIFIYHLPCVFGRMDLNKRPKDVSQWPMTWKPLNDLCKLDFELTFRHKSPILLCCATQPLIVCNNGNLVFFSLNWFKYAEGWSVLKSEPTENLNKKVSLCDAEKLIYLQRSSFVVSGATKKWVFLNGWCWEFSLKIQSD